MINTVIKTSAAALLLSANFALAKTSDEAPVEQPNESSLNAVIVPFDINGCTKDDIRVYAGFTAAVGTYEEDITKHLEPTRADFERLDREFEAFLETKDINNIKDTDTFLQGEFFASVVPEVRSSVERTLRTTYPDAEIYWALRHDSLRAANDPSCAVH